MQIVKKKSESPFRWPILFFTCLMMIGNYYCYDIPAALNSQMDEYFGKPSDFETLFSLLYTVYSVPNIILPFFGGYFIDRLGVRVCMIVFSLCITVGQLVFALGLSIKSWPLMFLGRIIFGFGGENLGVANSAILSVWFEGKELAFSFGLNLSIARLGSVINNLVSPSLANSVGIQFALWFGVILCGSSVAACLFISSIDAHVDSIIGNKGAHEILTDADDEDARESKKKLREMLMPGADDDTKTIDFAKSDANESSRTLSVNESERDFPLLDVDKEEVKFKDLFSFRQIFWILSLICVIVYGCVLPFNNIASALLLERNYFQEPPSSCHLYSNNSCESPWNQPVDCPSSKWYQPPLPYNVTADDIDCSDDYWSDGCGKTYCDRQSDAQVEAGTIMSIPYIISACLSPFLGGFVDKFGYRAVLATLAPLALLAVHGFLGFSSVDPVGPLVGQGLSYCAFAAVVWPSVALVVDQKLIGLAYGIVVSIQNCGLATFPLIIASIYSSAGNKYIPNVEVFFMSLAIAGCAIGVYLNYLDYFYENHILNSPGGDKERKMSIDEFSSKRLSTNPLHDDEKEQLYSSEDIKGFDNSRSSHHSRSQSSEIFATSMIH